MNRLFLFLILFFLNQSIIAQIPSFFLVNLAIEEKSLINQAQNDIIKKILLNKLTSICNNVEGVIIDEFSDYYLVSDIYSSQSQISNAGFLPVGSYKMNFKLKLRYKSGGKTFKELNFSKDYAVNTESEAAKLLINDFSFSESDLSDFFNEGSKKMTKFYSENCNSVIESAKKYQKIGEPEKALAICLTIPTDVPCYKNIDLLTKELYTSLSYKSDFSIFLLAQELVSKGDYDDAFSTLKEISIYSQFYPQAQLLVDKINEFIFNQKELQKKSELAESENELKKTDIKLQQERNELQESINQTNIEIANQKNKSELQIAIQKQEREKEMKAMELQSQERKEMIKTAGSFLNAYVSRPQPPNNTNFYIIK